MDLKNLPKEYTIADGPEGLAKELDALLASCQQSTEFAAKEHYIFYQLGAQRSWIQVDTSKTPFYFDYYDKDGRVATMGVKNTIARFLWDKCGEKDRHASQSFEEYVANQLPLKSHISEITKASVLGVGLYGAFSQNQKTAPEPVKPNSQKP